MIKVNLSRLLGERRMSQSDLARKTGIRPNTINDLYHEIADRVNLEHLDRICEALSCPLEEIMEYIPNRVQKTGKNLIVEEHGLRKKKGEDS